MLVPQGVGVMFDCRLDDFGKTINGTDSNMMVLDIGFNTLDYVAVKNGVASKEFSGTMDREGICKIVDDVLAQVAESYKVNVTSQEISGAIPSGSLKAFGKSYDLTGMTRKAIRRYIERLKYNFGDQWNAFLQRSDKLIVAGGGAYYLKRELISEKYQSQYWLINSACKSA